MYIAYYDYVCHDSQKKRGEMRWSFSRAVGKGKREAQQPHDEADGPTDEEEDHSEGGAESDGGQRPAARHDARDDREGPARGGEVGGT